ncbi:FAD-dependent oxidoreductase [Coraliomargarita parva]|uniref:FAD-dependent oxidoreductase n=1 Tax=Coraliomargarita parva TaxID=3014050 RepID=UPI0022B5BA29|nr:GMC family oxidoreductase [Coraliomargarita parva]
MILDLSSIPPEDLIESDVCIVGAGVAGLILAKELSRQGLQITVLESGGRDVSAKTQALNQGENIGYPYYPLDLVRERCVGGSSSRWGIELPNEEKGVRLRPMDPIDFETRADIPHSGWPFPKSTLDPYYERAHAIFGLGPCDYTAQRWSDPEHYKTLALDPDTIETTLFQFGPADRFTGTIQSEIRQMDSVQLFLNATVLEILCDESVQKVKALRVAADKDREYRITARYYILASGGIEVPRLLLLSDKQQPEGLGNRYDLVGRYFMEHPHFLSGMLIPNSTEIFENTGLYQIHKQANSYLLAYLKLSESVLRREGLLNYCVSLWPRDKLEEDERSSYLSSKAFDAIRKIRCAIHIGERPQALAKQLYTILAESQELITHLFSKVTKSKLVEPSGPPIAFQLHHMWEQAPNPDSRITLSRELDQFGQRLPILNWKVSERDVQTLSRSLEILGDACEQAGIGRIVRNPDNEFPPKGITGGLHHMGTTRMNEAPEQGVVDGNCKIHGIDNLYIAGSSVFPTSGYANPTLTIGALAIRLADHLTEQLSKSNGPVLQTERSLCK